MKCIIQYRIKYIQNKRKSKEQRTAITRKTKETKIEKRGI